MKNKANDQKNFDEIVFEKKNQQYGAYALRAGYDTHVTSSLFLTFGSFALLVLVPIFIQFMVSKNNLDLGDLIKPEEDNSVHEYRNIEIPKTIKVDIVHEQRGVASKTADAASTFKTVTDSASSTTKTFDPLANNNTGKGNDNSINNGHGGGSSTKNDSVKIENNDLVDFSEVNPEFPGGEAEMFRFLSKHIKYPESAKEDRQGTVYISFVVDKLGKVKDVELLKGLRNACDNEAMRVINSFPNWKPGLNNGKAVNVRFKIPIKFVLRG